MFISFCQGLNIGLVHKNHRDINNSMTQNDALFDQADLLIKQNKVQEAKEILEKLIEADQQARFYSKLGTVNMIMGNREGGFEHFKKSFEIDPDHVPTLANLALFYSETGMYKKALGFIQKAIKLNPSQSNNYSILALGLKHLNRPLEAIDALLEMPERESNLQAQLNLCGLLVEANRKEEAEEILTSIVGAHPDCLPAHKILSSFSDYYDDSENLKQFESLTIPNDMPAEMRADYYFSLGKIYETQKKFDQSFEAYDQGNTALRQTYEYNVESDRQYFEAIKETHVSKVEQLQPANNTEQRPIFIVGMPRSGTSLIEQIIAAHPDVYGAGELNSINLIYSSFLVNPDQDADGMRQKYLAFIEDNFDGRTIFTDKMPSNFRYLGFIEKLFPNATIVHCQRNKKDTALSLFKTKFSGFVPYAQNLKEIKDYMALYEETMDFWRDNTDLKIIDIQYEEFVQSGEQAIKDLIAYCDLEWDEQCLSFHQSKRVVTTASTLQVREPIYTKSIDYWKSFESHLTDLD